MTDEFSFTLDSPITEEEWDMIEDVDFEHTDKITFHTKHGKEVTFEKRKPGRWIPKPEMGYGGTWFCSECGEITVSSVMGKPRYRFCPMCGAKMKQQTHEIPTHCGPKTVKGGN